tara:strand:+ start:2763 stop:3218 length:456 start_codon:yes stop_codon:yes gene_type:complete
MSGVPYSEETTNSFTPSYGTFYLSSNQELPNNTPREVQLDGTTANSGHFSLSSGRVVVSTAGIYNINGGLYISSNLNPNPNTTVYFKKNNDAFALLSNTTNIKTFSGICLSLNANDEIYFECESIGGTSTLYMDPFGDPGPFCYISLFRVG